MTKIDTSAIFTTMDDFSHIVSSIKRRTGTDVYLVGGCVRDTVMGLRPKDYDLASAATPEQIIDAVDNLTKKTVKYRSNLRTEPTGIDHGTVSIIYNGIPFEHTTFRKDVATDGRRAVVEFADNLYDDSLRRDFTMNAIYYDILSHTIIDPHNGVDDIKANRLRWVGNAEERIQEDYLRIMRYFRFAAKYDLFMHPDDVEAIRKNVDGLASVDEKGKRLVSIERITSELLQILNYYSPFVVETMERCGVFKAIGLPFSATCYMQSFNSPDAAHRLLLSIMGPIDSRKIHLVTTSFTFGKKFNSQIMEWYESYNLMKNTSCVDITNTDEMSDFVYETIAFGLGEKILWILRNGHFYKDHMHWRACGIYDAVVGSLSNVFPLNGNDIRAKDYNGLIVGSILRNARIEWIKSNYSLTKEQLIDIVVSKFNKD